MEEQQIADKVNQMRINQQATQRFQEMQQPQEEAVPSTSTTDFPNQNQRLGAPYGLQDPLAESSQEESSVVGPAAEALQAMPPPGGQASAIPNTNMAQSLAGFGLEEMPSTGPAQPQLPMPVPTGVGYEQSTLQQNYAPQPPQNPGLQPHQVPPNNPNFRPQQQVVPQGQPYAGTPTSMIDPATGRPYNQREYFEYMRDNPTMTRSFVTQVLDEFGDMLHKADPHMAGLLAFRVYMDKIMR